MDKPGKCGSVLKAGTPEGRLRRKQRRKGGALCSRWCSLAPLSHHKSYKRRGKLNRCQHQSTCQACTPWLGVGGSGRLFQDPNYPCKRHRHPLILDKSRSQKGKIDTPSELRH